MIPNEQHHQDIRIIYGCPTGNTPSGGVKVIYKHSELLNHLGFQSHIWHPADDSFTCDWFDHGITPIATQELNPASDFIILPEIWATGYVPILKKQGFKVGIFVQNCYYTHVNLDSGNQNGIADAYHDADLVLSISSDTSNYLENILRIPREKIILQRYSIDSNLFRPNAKERLITYMPRKMSQHSMRVISALQPLLPTGWSIRPLDNMNEQEISLHLSRSIIFMAFSEFEGLPVPPVEAALSGNIVIGYHGQGGKEYWRAPNFIPVEQGDLQDFILKILATISEISSDRLNLDSLNAGMHRLAHHFSNENERQMLTQLGSAIKRLY